MEFLELFLRRRLAEGNQWWRRMTGYLSVHCWPVSTLSKLIHFECFAVLRSYPLVKTWPHSKSREQTFPFWLLTDTVDATYRIFSMWLKQWEKEKSSGFWPSSRSSQLGREKRSYETEVSAYGLKTFVAPFLTTPLTAGSRWFLPCFRLPHSWASVYAWTSTKSSSPSTKLPTTHNPK